jgi:hypothetical protein
LQARIIVRPRRARIVDLKEFHQSGIRQDH